MIGDEPRFWRRVTLKLYTKTQDRWIGYYFKDQQLQNSDCKYRNRTYYICLIPCLVLEFDTNKWIKHKKGCWHKEGDRPA